MSALTLDNIITLVQISDGAQGPAGPQGPVGESADSYKIETNVEEILQFVSEEEGLSYKPSPEEIYYTLTKEGQDLDFDKIDTNLKLLCFYNSTELEIGNNYYDFHTIGDEKQEHVIKFNLSNFLELTYVDGKRLYEQLPIIFELRYIIDNKILTKRLVYNYGLSLNMLNFSVNASDINALIQSTALSFDSYGLTVSGGNFRIKDKVGDEEKVVLEATGEGTLTLNNIISNSGTIGGFTIYEGKLISTDGSESLQFLGKDGKIIAKEIILGIGATIEKYITFTNREGELKAYLCNPSENAGQLLVGGSTGRKNLEGGYEGSLIIKANGDASFGEIKIDSSHSKISASYNNDSTLNCWELGPDKAIFNNIVANGSIETAIFKKSYTQAVGGTMIFKPSYKISNLDTEDWEETSKIVATIEGSYEGTKNNKVWLVPRSGPYVGATIIEFAASSSIEDSTDITLQIETKKFINTKYEFIIDLGNTTDQFQKVSNEEFINPNQFKKYYVLKDGVYQHLEDLTGNTLELYEQNTGPAIIGINSGNSFVGESYILPRGLTITEYSNGDQNKKPSLFLGDLTSIGLKGYGLYSNNVYLKGSLTTEGEGCYAGISTLEEVKVSYTTENNGFEDDSAVVFWAGSMGTGQEIQASNFLVTKNGTAVMKTAYIQDSIFANGIIKGATLETAEIRGTGNGNALSIYDTAGGIGFYNDKEYNETGKDIETCRITQKGFYSKEDGVSVSFERDGSTELEAAYLKMDKQGFYLEQNYANGGTTKSGLFLRKLDEKTSNMSLIYENQDTIIIDTSAVKCVMPFKVSSTVELGRAELKKAASGQGYDLYIRE